MKKLIIGLLIIGCNAEKTTGPDLETRVKKYMTDTVIHRFHDPASYEFVSMKVDTFTGRKYLNNIAKYAINERDTSFYARQMNDKYRKEMEQLESIEGYKDSVLHLPITVNYRGKNKMGALVLNSLKLRYYPAIGEIKEVE